MYVGMYVSIAETDLRLLTRGQRAGVKLRVILRSYARLSCTRMSEIVNPRVNLSYMRVTWRECPPCFSRMFWMSNCKCPVCKSFFMVDINWRQVFYCKNSSSPCCSIVISTEACNKYLPNQTPNHKQWFRFKCIPMYVYLKYTYSISKPFYLGRYVSVSRNTSSTAYHQTSQSQYISV